MKDNMLLITVIVQFNTEHSSYGNQILCFIDNCEDNCY